MDRLVYQALLKAKLLDKFKTLPSSHQNEYLKWVAEAKKLETKNNRIIKMIEMIR